MKLFENVEVIDIFVIMQTDIEEQEREWWKTERSLGEIKWNQRI